MSDTPDNVVRLFRDHTKLDAFFKAVRKAAEKNKLTAYMVVAIGEPQDNHACTHAAAWLPDPLTHMEFSDMAEDMTNEIDRLLQEVHDGIAKGESH